MGPSIQLGAQRFLFALSGVMGFLAVALGAFGAHGLKRSMEALTDGAQRLAWWQTAAQYHLTHALALAAAAYLVGRVEGAPAKVAGGGFAIGILLFSGSLYVMTLTGARWLGAVTPLGGLSFLVGWAALVWAALKL